MKQAVSKAELGRSSAENTDWEGCSVCDFVATRCVVLGTSSGLYFLFELFSL
jgi:hypothetical protein